MKTAIVTDSATEKTYRRQFWVRSVIGLVLAALSAALFILAFPPYDLWLLIWVGLVPMLVAQHRILPRCLSGLATGVSVGGFFWGYFSNMFANSVWYMRWLPLMIGIVAALVGGRERAFHERTCYRWFVFQGAALWVGIEMIRGFVPVIGTWGFAAYALYEQPWLIQPVSVFGIYGLSLLILLTNYALAQVTLALFDRCWRLDSAFQPVALHHARSWLVGVGAALAAWIGLSMALLDAPAPDVRVAAVQPAIRIRSEEGLQWLYAQTRRAAAQGAKLIVWNEGALPFDPQVEHTEELRALAFETGTYLVIGYGIRTEQGLRNEVTVLAPEGEFLGVYGKDHPVAFAGETSLTRGSYPVYNTTLGRLGTIICYDLDFTDTARRVARNGVQLIAVPSFDWPAIAAKHYSHVVFRAVENRVAMVKADIAFDSAIIDPYGRIIKRAVKPVSEPATLVADVPLGTANAPAIFLGDWVGWLCLAGMIFFIVLDLLTAFWERESS
ncbi:nitrilase/cyanide hydratase [Thermacetogenium phaeum DSM 12270]|uniref:Nitrilase/cyanide hydratase n=1 Tax=Thermacetogenium phaeum (strain ATCC BAA-254 / DSM 26808 / PB) TaxID=1089553 RepID=K4LKA2_THEPS|nr:nitrilase-related carbon-nitrogen hydrolase [Thermacetogenium phaeum]AFV12380.1 nitrilase/cyanide hydratase [Thermacetogenium phaeum DSM 12270]